MKDTKWTEQDDKLNDAIIFAIEKHKGQKRKGTDYPYIVHPLEVLSILADMNMERDVLIAGVLHDVVEDTDTSPDTIRALFGDFVADLVAGHTDDKTLPWKERKEKALAELANATFEIKCVTFADKLSNLRAIARDYKVVGDEVWGKFTAPKEEQAWYYAAGIDALDDMMNYPETRPFYWELNELYQDVFVKYYYDEDSDTMWQKAVGEGAYTLGSDSQIWTEWEGDIPESAEEIPHEAAQRIEDNWIEGLDRRAEED